MDATTAAYCIARCPAHGARFAILASVAVNVIVIEVEVGWWAMRERGLGTPGGARLRALREGFKRPQLWVEAEAELGTGYLQRVGAGRVIQPGRATLERILDALGARYSERKEVLALFGYLVPTPLPSDSDRAWVCIVSARQLREAPFPAYALDCATRLIAWNGPFARLLADAVVGLRPEALAGRPLLAHWFDPASPLASLVAAPGVFLPATIRALRYEMVQLRAEEWYGAWLAQLQILPRFRRYWEQVAAEQETASAARALVPVALSSPRLGAVQFRLATEPFTRDARFRLVYYFPADADTLRRCAVWAEAVGQA